METSTPVKMRVIFTCETMEQLAVIWAMAKQTGLQPDLVPDMPARERKAVDREKKLKLGQTEPHTKDRKTLIGYERIRKEIQRVGYIVRAEAEHHISTARKDDTGPRIVGLWLKSNTLTEA